jgi:hypothetical protein
VADAGLDRQPETSGVDLVCRNPRSLGPAITSILGERTSPAQRATLDIWLSPDNSGMWFPQRSPSITGPSWVTSIVFLPGGLAPECKIL